MRPIELKTSGVGGSAAFLPGTEAEKRGYGGEVTSYGRMVLDFRHGVVTQRRTVRDAVFDTAEIEHIRIAGEAPAFEPRDVKSKVTAVLIAEA